MPRRQAPLQVNDFTGGLNTEFTFLQAPPNVTTDEQNMEITRRGSRKKRLGFDFESGYTEQNSGVAYDNSRRLGRSVFKWDNAGGDVDKSLLAVQIGHHFAIYDFDSTTGTSSDQIYSENFNVSFYTRTFNYAVVDGFLIVATGEKEVNIYTYESDTVTKSTDTLLIRDLFGVEAYDDDGTELTKNINVQLRPASLTEEHIYNLRNQTFGPPRPSNDSTDQTDPIQAFANSTSGSSDLPFLGVPSSGSSSEYYPSNADNLIQFFYADPNASSDKLLERFFSDDMVKTAPNSSKAPVGYFVIDALERGNSRLEREASLRDNNTELVYVVSDLPRDKTPGGASVVTEFAGRCWYGGFSSELIDGDKKSPRMSSYLLFSSLIKDKSDITQCYQKADPTSPVEADLVETDGGFIRIEGAYGINKLIAVQNSLFVFSLNGVWRVTGAEGGAFTATGYQVEKLSERGCLSGNSVVVVDDNIFFWGEGGIYVIMQNQFAEWSIEDLTRKTIQNFYNDIDDFSKSSCSGQYDSFEKKIRWVYTTELEEAEHSNELVFNIDFKSFSYNRIEPYSGSLPLVTNVFITDPYKLTEKTVNVTASGVLVTDSSGDAVTSTLEVRDSKTKEVKYLVITNLGSDISYSFGGYNASEYYEWAGSYGSVGYDAYMITGSFTGGEGRFSKQVPYLTVFMEKTEDGFDSSFNVTTPSSCLLSTRWNWTDNSNAGKWTTPRQIYRLKPYIPASSSDTYDNGEKVISTRNKIRGSGSSVAFKFDSEYGKALHIYGWAFDILANSEE